jgi:ubiquitin-protein ligase E3 B
LSNKIYLFKDAFRSLQNASSTIWKNTIRISFINQQGLAEAGIDQNGIFKEFIQEITQQAFDPSFNLFKVFRLQRLSHRV